MRKMMVILGLGFVCSILVLAATTPADLEKNWPQWRGPLMTGVAPAGDPAVVWSETKNVRWKIALPGKGHSTPIVWGDRIFVSTAVPVGKADAPAAGASAAPQPSARMGMPSTKTTDLHKFVVLCINRQDGKVVWERTVREEVPQEATHEFGSWASSSSVTDGERLYAYFGSRGLFCLDMNGKIIWERDFGQLSKRMEFGEGDSPALAGDKIVVTWDHEKSSFIVAVDKKTGRDVWKVDRAEGTSWATPVVVEVNGKSQVITSATKLIRSYDLETGALIWQCGGMTANAIPTPFAADGILYVMSGFRGNALLAIRLAEAKGDISDSGAIVWRRDKDTPYAPSGLLLGSFLYFLRGNNGILTCLDAKTGKEYYSGERLEDMGNIFASLSAAKDRIIITGQQGTFTVIQHGPAFKILAKNKLDDNFHASPVIVGRQLFLRGFKYLYCIEEKA